jgi:hypothetical protein
MRKLVGIGVVVLITLQFSAVLTFFVIYPRYRTKSFRQAQSDPPVACKIEKNYQPATCRFTQNEQWVGDLDRSFREAEYFRPNHPRKDREFYLQVFRKSSKTDQYVVFLDTRGPEYDHFQVVNRSGNTTWFGSAFRSPHLRRLMEESGVK